MTTTTTTAVSNNNNKNCTNNNNNNSSNSRNRDQNAYSKKNEYYLSSLIEFTNRLGSSVLDNEPAIADEYNVRREAELLMSLSSPSCSSSLPLSNDKIINNTAAVVINCDDNDNNNENNSDNSSANSSSSSSSLSSFRHHSSLIEESSFSFICPSLSLEPRSCSSDYYYHSSPSSLSSPLLPPSSLLGRVLKINDKNALRLSSDAMVRNFLISFKKALKWRIQAWIDSLSASLIKKEREYYSSSSSSSSLSSLDDDDNDNDSNNNSEENGVLQKLLRSNNAKLIVKLREVSNTIEVIQAQTNFKVLSSFPAQQQRVRCKSAKDHVSTATTTLPLPLKKKERKRSNNNQMTTATAALPPSNTTTKKKIKKRKRKSQRKDIVVKHALSFEGIINVYNPSVGYCEIEVSVPGTIEGKFSKSTSISSSNNKTLNAVSIEINTNIFSAMVEKKLSYYCTICCRE